MEPSEFCAHCGDPVSTGGPRPRRGVRYCTKAPCRAAKAAAAYRPAPERPPAPTSCSNCGCDLPARPQRAGDAAGRWCTKPRCREARAKVQEKTGVDQVAELVKEVDALKMGITFLSEALLADDPGNWSTSRVHCPECGLTSALEGWPHPLNAEFTAVCRGTVGKEASRPITIEAARAGWPMPLVFEPVVPSE